MELINAVLCDALGAGARRRRCAQAIAAIENALLDIKGKALGVPVYELFGGPVRERIPVYWSHCGSYRVRKPTSWSACRPLRTYDDIAEARRRGEARAASRR